MDREHRVRFGTLTEEGESDIRYIRQSDIRACPHVILVPEHYRQDGSCRCDDQTHAEMAEWGYIWRNGRWQA